jgi:AsmA-like C-terminal region
MAEIEQRAPGNKRPRPRWHWVAAVGLVLIVVLSAAGIAIWHAEPILRGGVIDTLSTRFKSKVELDAFHVSLFKGLQVSGNGLRIFGESDPNNYEPGVQPIIDVGQFRFRLGIRAFLRTPIRVDTVYVNGLVLNLPPREQRGQLKKMEPKGKKIKIIVDRFVCEDAKLIVNTLKPGKLPLEIDIESLNLNTIRPGAPLHFEAKLTNPKPVGHIDSNGQFGPWQTDSPRDTPVSGNYSFSHADLSTIKGIGGMLSSTGKYNGVLDKIVVDGETDTPDFRIATAGRPVPLHTDFHAIVDGTNGDTILQPVKAKLLYSFIVANGSVVRKKNPPGHDVELEVAIEEGRIEDLLKLAVRTDPPVVTGSVRLHAKFDLPPGEHDVAKRMKLEDSFSVGDAHFTNEKIQDKIDALSRRSQGKLKQVQDSATGNVYSDLKGKFTLNEGLLSFSELEFQIPGTRMNLTGTYSLDGNQFDFHGKVRMDAKLSQMVTGWKSILLKPVDPFFHKDGAGTEIPVKISGTKSEPHFGLDFGHKDKDEEKNAKPNGRN